MKIKNGVHKTSIQYSTYVKPTIPKKNWEKTGKITILQTEKKRPLKGTQFQMKKIYIQYTTENRRKMKIQQSQKYKFHLMIIYRIPTQN